MEKKEYKLVVELRDVKPSFRVNAYVASIAYRALPWAGSVKVLEDGKRLVEMDRREEK